MSTGMHVKGHWQASRDPGAWIQLRPGSLWLLMMICRRLILRPSQWIQPDPRKKSRQSRVAAPGNSLTYACRYSLDSGLGGDIVHLPPSRQAGDTVMVLSLKHSWVFISKLRSYSRSCDSLKASS